MKRLLLIIALGLYGFVSFGQSLTIDQERKDVIWEASYNTTWTKDDILEHLLAYNLLDNIVTHRDMIAGDTYGTFLDYESEGYRRANLPIYMLNGHFKCRLIIRCYDGYYTVEGCQMRFIDMNNGLLGTTHLYEARHSDSFDKVSTLVLKHLMSTANFEAYK